MSGQIGTSRPIIWLCSAEPERRHAERLQQGLSLLPADVQSSLDTRAGDDQIATMLAQIDSAHLAVVLISVELLDNARWREQLLPRLLLRTQSDQFQMLLVSARACPKPVQLKDWPWLTFDGKPLSSGTQQQQDLRYQKICRALAWALGLPLPADAQNAAISRYMDRLVDEFQSISARGTAGPHQRQPLPSLPLEEVFVWPTLKEASQPAYHERALRLWRAVSQQEISSLIWRQTLQNRMKLIESGSSVHFNIPIIDIALLLYAHVMIIGKPGSGKSSLLDVLALRAAKQRDRLPVRCSLSELARSDDIYRAIHAILKKRYGTEIEAAFSEWLTHGKVLLLLDGADEVPASRRRQTMEMVQRLLRTYPSLQCVVTSRPVESAYLDEDIAHLTVEDFSYDQIRDYVYRYKRCRAKVISIPTPDADAKRLFDEIGRFPELLRGPAGSPLLLFVLCLLDERRGHLPTQLMEIYEAAIDTLTTTWPQVRSKSKLQALRELDAESIRRALTQVALAAHQQADDRMPRALVLAALADGLCETGQARSADKAALRYLHALGPNAGLLQEVEPKHYAFLHGTFREYLVGCHIAEQIVCSWSYREELLAHRDDSRWHEVSRFVLKHLGITHEKPALAGRLLVAIAEETTPSWEPVRYEYLLNAAKLLDDGRGFDPAAVRRVFASLTRAASLPVNSITKVFVEVAEHLHVPMDDEVATALRALFRHNHKGLLRAAFHVLAGSAASSTVAVSMCGEGISSANDDGIRFLGAVGVARAAVDADDISPAAIQALAAACAESVSGWLWARELFTVPPTAFLLRLQQGLREPELRHHAAILLACVSGELSPELLADVLAAILEVLAAPKGSRAPGQHALHCLLALAPTCVPAVLDAWAQSFAETGQPAVQRSWTRGEPPTPEQMQETLRREIEEVLRKIASQNLPVIAGLVQLLLHPPESATATALSRQCQSLLAVAAEQHRNSWEPPPQEQSRQWLLKRLADGLGSPEVRGEQCLEAAELLRRISAPIEDRIRALAACLRQTRDPELRWRAMNESPIVHDREGTPSSVLGPILDALECALHDPAPSLHLHAVYWLYGVSRIPREQLVPLLRPCLDQESDLTALRDAITFAQEESLVVGPPNEPPELLLAPCCAESLLAWPEPNTGRKKRSRQTGLVTERQPHIRPRRRRSLDDQHFDPETVPIAAARRFCDQLFMRLRIGVAKGANLSIYQDDWILHLCLRVCCEHRDLRDELVRDLTSTDLPRKKVADSILRWMIIPTSNSDRRQRLRELKQVLTNLLAPYLQSEELTVRWAVHDLVRWHGLLGTERQQMLQEFLASSHPLPLRVRSMEELLAARNPTHRDSDGWSVIPSAVAVFRDALAVTSPALILQMVSLIWPCPAAHIDTVRDALLKVLPLAESPRQQLEVAAFLSLLDAISQEVAASELLKLLSSTAPLPNSLFVERIVWCCLHEQQSAFLARHDLSQAPEEPANVQGEVIEPASDEIGSDVAAVDEDEGEAAAGTIVIRHNEHAPLSHLPHRLDVGIAAAMLLFLMEQHREELKRSVMSWVEDGIAALLSSSQSVQAQAGVIIEEDEVGSSASLASRRCFAERLLQLIGGAEHTLARLDAAEFVSSRSRQLRKLPPIQDEPKEFWTAIVARVISIREQRWHVELWQQVVQRATVFPRVFGALAQALRVAMRDKDVHFLERWEAAARLYELGAVDDEVAEKLVNVEDKFRQWVDLLTRLRAMSRHPLIRPLLLAKLGDEDPEICIWAADRMEQTGDIEDFVKGLRNWLGRSDYSLKYEAARQLCEVSRCDSGVLAALEECLAAPIGEGRIYDGASIRHLAAELLCKYGSSKEEAVAAALLQVIGNVNGFMHDISAAAKLLLRDQAQHQAVADALCWVLRRRRPSRQLWSDDNRGWHNPEYPELLQLLHRTGCERRQALEFALICVAESNSTHEKVFRLLSGWDEPPVQTDDQEPVVIAKTKRQHRRYGLMQSLPGRARLLVETSGLPSVIPEVMASFLGQSSLDVLRLCADASRGADPTKADVALAASLMVGQPTDRSEQALARLYFFFRLAPWSGITMTSREVWHSDGDYFNLGEDLAEDGDDSETDGDWPSFGYSRI